MFLRLIFGGCLALAGIWAQPPGFPPAQASTTEHGHSPVLRAEADLVVLPVTVTDRRGESVAGLEAKDFHIYENGKRQTISLFHQTDVPVTVGLVVDCSGSMGANRSEVVESAREFLASSNPQDQLFVVNFNERASLGLPPSVPFTSDVSQLEAAVLRGPSAGMTALYDATALALRHLTLSTTDKKAIIIISDGGDNASHATFREVLAAAQHSDAIIYTVGIIGTTQGEVNPRILHKLARNTGGEAYMPRSAADLPSINRQIARDLREQYTIGYVPSDTVRDGSYRTIRVSVQAKGHGRLVARTRTGYFASPKPAKVRKGTGKVTIPERDIHGR